MSTAIPSIFPIISNAEQLFGVFECSGIQFSQFPTAIPSTLDLREIPQWLAPMTH
jgi:hypothetical protein